MEFASLPTKKAWKKIGCHPHHGVAVPLSSLRSLHSTGIGEYTDLALLVDWCKHVGFDIIQILPINDTGFGLSPYSALSAFALHPAYLDLKALPYLEKYPELVEKARKLASDFSTSCPTIADIVKRKMEFLALYLQESTPLFEKDPAFARFRTEASYWLKSYATFKSVQEENATVPELYFCLIQYFCDLQMQNAKAYAASKGVFIMGDLPILVDRQSVDVLTHPEFFDLRYSAGAPPDMLSADGQNWGFPIYNWEEIEKDGYTWWKERVRWASRYMHIYRIDHIVGFFKIWAIPFGKEGKDGFFIPSDESKWLPEGKKILTALISASDMLPIGEDLGAVPESVRECLKELGICGTRVMRWERKWHEDGSFILPQHYTEESMTTVSTHDTETLFQWWSHFPEESARYASEKGWSYTAPLCQEKHSLILKESHKTNSLFHINPIQEYLTLIPRLSWDDPNQERINVPGTFNSSNWTYRIRPTLEEMLQHTDLNTFIYELIH